MTAITNADARRIVLAAQGLTERPAGRVDVRHLRRAMDLVGCLQLDALNHALASLTMPVLVVHGERDPRPTWTMKQLVATL